ncbi:MAG TPA: PorV/PorQ family protein, partial [Bacteroidales bacterium]|nr:PorV/PorQ family protein [Bacteroidales bacterium]
MTLSKKTILTPLLLVAVILTSNAQTNNPDNYIGQFNPITTAVPFLMIAPDARGGAMGDAGVASEPDAFSMHYNPAKYAYIKKDMGVGISYSPWLKSIVNDINLAYLSGFKRLDKDQVIAMSLRYFNLGDINFTDANGWSIGNYKPNEFAIDGTYSRFLTSKLSMAVSARYIHSNLTQGQDVGGTATKPGNSVAADVA